jgi:hypothetical protein
MASWQHQPARSCASCAVYSSTDVYWQLLQRHVYKSRPTGAERVHDCSFGNCSRKPVVWGHNNFPRLCVVSALLRAFPSPRITNKQTSKVRSSTLCDIPLQQKKITRRTALTVPSLLRLVFAAASVAAVTLPRVTSHCAQCVPICDAVYSMLIVQFKSWQSQQHQTTADQSKQENPGRLQMKIVKTCAKPLITLIW